MKASLEENIDSSEIKELIDGNVQQQKFDKIAWPDLGDLGIALLSLSSPLSPGSLDNKYFGRPWGPWRESSRESWRNAVPVFVCKTGTLVQKARRVERIALLQLPLQLPLQLLQNSNFHNSALVPPPKTLDPSLRSSLRAPSASTRYPHP